MFDRDYWESSFGQVLAAKLGSVMALLATRALHDF